MKDLEQRIIELEKRIASLEAQDRRRISENESLQKQLRAALKGLNAIADFSIDMFYSL